MRTGLGLRIVSFFSALLVTVSATSSGIGALAETIGKIKLHTDEVPYYSRNPVPYQPGANASRDPQRTQWWTPEHMAQLGELKENREQGHEGPPMFAMVGKMFGLTASWNQNEMGRGITAEALGPGGGSAGSQILGTKGGKGLGGVVNTNTGNKLSTLPIVSIPVKGNLALSFSMFHNSIGADILDMGHGWLNNYDASLSVVSGGDVIVRMPDGLYVPYDFNSPNYDAPAGWFHKLTWNSGSSQWVLTFKNQSKYVFDSNGMLYQIKDRYGNAITITRYDPLTVPVAGLEYKIHYVSAADGRKLVFGYDANLKLHTITENLSGGWSNRTWTFDYDGSDDLASVTYPTNASLNNVREFAYNGDHDITRETDLEGKFWDFTYSSEKLTTFENPDNFAVTYSYSSGQTDIELPLGQIRSHYYSSGLINVIEDEGGFTDVCASYDSDRLVTVRYDKNSISWGYDYDSSGNLIQVLDPLSYGTWDFAYNGNNDLTQKVTPMGHETNIVYSGLLIDYVEQEVTSGVFRRTEVTQNSDEKLNLLRMRTVGRHRLGTTPLETLKT